MKIDLSALVRQAPSIATDHAAPGASDRYVHINTLSVLEILQDNGWFPHRASQQLVRSKDRVGYQRHWVYLRHASDMEPKVGEEVFEIILSNSHDRTKAWRFNAGIFRLVCSNGLVVSTATFAAMYLRHININAETIKAVANRASVTMSGVAENIDRMRNYPLEYSARLGLATAGLSAKYESLDRAPIHAHTLLQPRRNEDEKPDLWTTFNVIQENLIKGDQCDGKLDVFNRGYGASKPISQVDRQISVNQALWEQAENLLAARN